MPYSREHVIPEAPVIPGLVFRCFHSEADLPDIAAVMNASLTADGSKERITPAELANDYAHPVHWDPLQDSLLIKVRGKLVGCANTEWREEEDGTRLHFINLYLMAEWRGCGLERAVQCHMERYVRAAVANETVGIRRWFASKVPESWQERIEILRASGYTPYHHYFEMQRPLLINDLPQAVLPTGVTLRPPTPEHYRAIWEASVECFQDQQDYVVPSEESYLAWVSSPNLDPGLWQVAWDGDQIAGAAINVVHEGAWGETDDLFVRRPWRKQGLGRALLIESLHLFKARRLTTAGLGVDAENVSGALRLYESIGYRPYQHASLLRKPI